MLRQNILVNQDFYFSNTEVILKETRALNNEKNGTFGNIPTNLLKEVFDIEVRNSRVTKSSYETE